MSLVEIRNKCEKCGKIKKNTIKHKGKRMCFSCYFRERFPREYAECIRRLEEKKKKGVRT